MIRSFMNRNCVAAIILLIGFLSSPSVSRIYGKNEPVLAITENKNGVNYLYVFSSIIYKSAKNVKVKHGQALLPSAAEGSVLCQYEIREGKEGGPSLYLKNKIILNSLLDSAMSITEVHLLAHTRGIFVVLNLLDRELQQMQKFMQQRREEKIMKMAGDSATKELMKEHKKVTKSIKSQIKDPDIPDLPVFEGLDLLGGEKYSSLWMNFGTSMKLKDSAFSKSGFKAFGIKRMLNPEVTDSSWFVSGVRWNINESYRINPGGSAFETPWSLKISKREKWTLLGRLDQGGKRIDLLMLGHKIPMLRIKAL